MKKLNKRKLDLHKETVRLLQETMLEDVHGGLAIIPSHTCTTVTSTTGCIKTTSPPCV